MRDLHDLLEEVNDEKSFLAFARALMDDREPHEGRNVDEVGFSGDWANNDIFGFLEGGIAWAESSGFGESSNRKVAENPWQQFATFLYCGKTYE
ncbi:MAG: hypothetical protein OQK04_02530 [Kangiellaceae bacterium]|nr:hypothetical protein [Kangiellaceae bacterium]MCW8997580.1 hypothetical protein [Kangiellaceae bacterium]